MEFYQVIIDIVLFAFVAIVSWAAKTYLLPYIQDKHLESIAQIVVHAAESAFGAGHGEQKLSYAIQLVNDKFNINVDADKVITAIEAAWKAMDIEQTKSDTTEVSEEE